jgi:hypothetical protein
MFRTSILREKTRSERFRCFQAIYPRYLNKMYKKRLDKGTFLYLILFFKPQSFQVTSNNSRYLDMKLKIFIVFVFENVKTLMVELI